MNDTKYIGLDVHQAAISATVLDSAGQKSARDLGIIERSTHAARRSVWRFPINGNTA